MISNSYHYNPYSMEESKTFLPPRIRPQAPILPPTPILPPDMEELRINQQLPETRIVVNIGTPTLAAHPLPLRSAPRGICTSVDPDYCKLNKAGKCKYAHIGQNQMKFSDGTPYLRIVTGRIFENEVIGPEALRQARADLERRKQIDPTTNTRICPKRAGCSDPSCNCAHPGQILRYRNSSLPGHELLRIVVSFAKWSH